LKIGFKTVELSAERKFIIFAEAGEGGEASIEDVTGDDAVTVGLGEVVDAGLGDG
jgi:hypothetical protein